MRYEGRKVLYRGKNITHVDFYFIMYLYLNMKKIKKYTTSIL